MRINPIRACADPARVLNHLDHGLARLREPCCRPLFPERRCFRGLPLLAKRDCLAEPVRTPLNEHDVDAILLHLALAGRLRRMQSFDWQVVHGRELATRLEQSGGLDVRV